MNEELLQASHRVALDKVEEENSFERVALRTIQQQFRN